MKNVISAILGTILTMAGIAQNGGPAPGKQFGQTGVG